MRVGRRCARSPRAGDVLIVRAKNGRELGREGYRLRVGRRLKIVAPTTTGVFYGGRTLLQMLRSDEPIPAGRARDVPRYPERGMMIDAGRQYYTPAWIKGHIRELAYLKLNYLHLHLSDHQGFRIASSTHPEIVSSEHLTKPEVREILRVARRHHVTVVPEIDMPGHMTAALAPHPEFRLRSLTGEEAGVLDVSNPDAREFAFDLVREYLRLFGGPTGRYWHVGADEVIPFVFYPLGLYPSLEAYATDRYGPTANAKDAIHGFVNDINAIVRRHGLTTRMWHDDLNGGSAVTRDPNIVAEWWIDSSPLSDTKPPTPQELIDRGHQIINAGWFPTYYVNGVGGSTVLIRPNMEAAYEGWEPYEFHGIQETDPPDTIDPASASNLGSILHVWNDNPGLVTEEETADVIVAGLRVIAQKTWGSERLTESFADFEPLIETLGHARGYHR